MQITLNHEEIRKALSEAISHKLKEMYSIVSDDCWFEVESTQGIVTDIEFINFCYEIDDDDIGVR